MHPRFQAQIATNLIEGSLKSAKEFSPLQYHQEPVIMGAKPSRRRHARSFRALRVEHLENRAMLSGSPVVGAPPIIAAAPPPAITLVAINAMSDLWEFEGTVTDNGKPVAGLKVQFGGVLSRYNLTTIG